MEFIKELSVVAGLVLAYAFSVYIAFICGNRFSPCIDKSRKINLRMLPYTYGELQNLDIGKEVCWVEYGSCYVERGCICKKDGKKMLSAGDGYESFTNADVWPVSLCEKIRQQLHY